MPGKPAKPKGVSTQYVMQPFEVKLSYNGKSWITVPLEVGHNEIGDADDPDMLVAAMFLLAFSFSQRESLLLLLLLL